MTDKLYNLRKSFVYAFRGIAFCIRYERNMRIHIAATVYMMYFALRFYDFTRTELIVLILTCAMVITLEIVNTAIEVLTDKASPRYSTLAKIAKDTAAGAVLVASTAAIVIGGILFWDINRFKSIALYYGVNTIEATILVISLFLTCLLIFNGKERRKRKVERDREDAE